MIKRDLVEKLPHMPVINLPAVDEDDSALEAKRYAGLVAGGGLDLTLLGLGQNGHIGMNEPGTGADSPTRVVELAKNTSDHAVEAYGSNRPPTWGITLGMALVLKSRQIWLLVTGSHKSEILSRTLGEPVGSQLPATFLRDHPNVTVFADESAASLLA